MELFKAKNTANKYKDLLSEYCDRCEIAGSIRREKSEVKDIELVCIPKSIPIMESSFFSEDVKKSELRDMDFIKTVNSFERIKGNAEGKYVQIKLPEGINLDLFITSKEQWGVIFMIRTGSAEFSKRMVTEIKKYGYRVENGFLMKKDKIIPCYEEKDFFMYTEQNYIQPIARIF